MYHDGSSELGDHHHPHLTVIVRRGSSSPATKVNCLMEWKPPQSRLANFLLKETQELDDTAM
jgi:hypothetical protein